MSSRVRIHSAEDFKGKPITIIGVSNSEVGFAEHPEFREFLKRHHIVDRAMPAGLAPEAGASAEYRVLRPPLTEQQIFELGAVCVGGVHEGVSYPGFVGSDNDGAYVFDNRLTPPGKDLRITVIAQK